MLGCVAAPGFGFIVRIRLNQVHSLRSTAITVIGTATAVVANSRHFTGCYVRWKKALGEPGFIHP
jgi:hypothetical protein